VSVVRGDETVAGGGEGGGRVIRAFLVTETHLNVSGIAFAESAGRARMIAVRSAWEVGFPAKVTTTRVIRAPEYDGRMPSPSSSGRFFTIESLS
jgi:hypothetical protein